MGLHYRCKKSVLALSVWPWQPRLNAGMQGKIFCNSQKKPVNSESLLYSKDRYTRVYEKSTGKLFPLKKTKNTEMGCYTILSIEMV